MAGSKITSSLYTSRNDRCQNQTGCNKSSSSNGNGINNNSTSPTVSAAKTTVGGITRLAVCLVVLLALLEATNAQNVHFSNGWYPGKKRSASPSALASSPILSGAAAASPLMRGDSASSAGSVSGGAAGGISACNVRPDLGEIIYKVILEEMVRLHLSCPIGIPRDIREILENAVCKQNKW